jgi:hypothetical protein
VREDVAQQAFVAPARVVVVVQQPLVAVRAVGAAPL